ncbi:hypothetical protein RND81_01G146100 [Saponaria officinalis]|uniref:Uncharacterized protein n=1 Tax=Saponaria officinalis TaxID=3572 RepID=A0AAW1NFU0_SAPOF
MRDLLDNFKAAKNDKEKRVREFEDEILGSYRGNDDHQLAYARHHSRMQHEIDHRRQYEQNAFGAGGSRVDPQLHRSGSVQETVMRRGGTFEPTNTAKSRLRARVVDLEKDHPKQKQSKIYTGWLKKANK